MEAFIHVTVMIHLLSISSISIAVIVSKNWGAVPDTTEGGGVLIRTMQGYALFTFAVLALTGCADNQTIGIEKKPKTMPDMNQGVSPVQRRAIMSGERPDWSDHYPVPRIPKKNSQ